VIRVRHHADGTLWIPRADPETEASLDAKYDRWRPGELRWIPRAADRRDWTDVRNGLDFGRQAVLVGKGPSLDTWDHRRGRAILAGLNEAALVVDAPDFVFFVDARVGEALTGCLEYSTVPVRPPAVDRLPELEPGAWSLVWRWTEGFRDHGVPSPFATAPAALTILARWGVQELLLVGFDGFDGPHAGRVYAAALDPVKAVDRETSEYALINRQIREVIDRFGLAVAWWHRGERLEDLPSSSRGRERP